MTLPETTIGMPRRSFVAAVFAALGSLFARGADGQSARPKPPSTRVRVGRRIVTGVDNEGRSRVDSEAPVPINARLPAYGGQVIDFWVIRELPTPLAGVLEPTREWRIFNRAPSGGAICRLITWVPGFEYRLHTTPTLDFCVIVSGQMELILEKESRILGPGDVVIQRGTAHGWRVVGPEPCTWVVILFDAARPGA